MGIMNWRCTLSTSELRVYEAGPYRIVGTLHLSEHGQFQARFTLTYKGTELDVFDDLPAAHARAAHHAALNANVAADLRATGRLN
jgi:hypothetical protein